MYVKPVARPLLVVWPSPAAAAIAAGAGMAKDAVDVFKNVVYVFCFSLSSTLLLYGQIMGNLVKEF